MRSSLARRIFFVTVTMTLWGSLASAASIGLFADSTCTSCNLTIPFGSTRTMYGSAVMEGLPQSPLVGAALRIEGPPAFWIIDVTPNPAAASVFGDLFGSGAAITFPWSDPRFDETLLGEYTELTRRISWNPELLA